MGRQWHLLTICKSFEPRSRQITTTVPHHSVIFTGRMPFLPPNQQHQSTEGIINDNVVQQFWRTLLLEIPGDADDDRPTVECTSEIQQQPFLGHYVGQLVLASIPVKNWSVAKFYCLADVNWTSASGLRRDDTVLVSGVTVPIYIISVP